ncbi:MAG: hypothetical protein ACQEQO_05905 [Thermodesulfobacteriota bacterium]
MGFFEVTGGRVLSFQQRISGGNRGPQFIGATRRGQNSPHKHFGNEFRAFAPSVRKLSLFDSPGSLVYFYSLTLSAIFSSFGISFPLGM